MNIADALATAARQLANAGVPEHVREASSLLQFVLGKERVFLIAHPEYVLSNEERAMFSGYLQRRSDREPMQYITGRQEFYGLEMNVTSDVLIPRPETEMVVTAAVELLRGRGEPSFAEVGVGSGCITVAILVNAPKAQALGSDISEATIEVASANAERHGVRDRLEMIRSDIFAAFPARRFDLIVSNPPYVPAAEIAGLQPEVRTFEPLSALTDGGDGLSIIERIIRGAPKYLSPGGGLMLEIGFGQAAQVAAMFDAAIWEGVRVDPDFQGIPRMAAAFLRQK